MQLSLAIKAVQIYKAQIKEKGLQNALFWIWGNAFVWETAVSVGSANMCCFIKSNYYSLFVVVVYFCSRITLQKDI